MRTFLAELGSANKAYSDRILREADAQIEADPQVRKRIENGEKDNWRKPINHEPTEEEWSKIEHAESSVLASLAKQILALTEELAGDIDQDITTWKPPPE